MTDKEDFFDFIYCGGDYGGNRKFYKTDLTAEEVYNWFQSKQQREDYEFTRKEIIEWLHEQNWKCEKLEKLLIQPKK